MLPLHPSKIDKRIARRITDWGCFGGTDRVQGFYSYVGNANRHNQPESATPTYTGEQTAANHAGQQLLSVKLPVKAKGKKGKISLDRY